MDLIDTLGKFASIVLPMWNIPMIARMIKRKSSEDISLFWVTGVWVCFMLMLPSGLRSTDDVWRTFNIVNIVFFTAVIICVYYYRFIYKGEKKLS